MQRDIQVLSTLLAAFISAELEFVGGSKKEIDDICDNLETNKILEEIIDYFKSKGAVIYLKGKTVEMKMYNVMCFNMYEAKKYYETFSKESLKESPVLTIADFIGNEKIEGL